MRRNTERDWRKGAGDSGLPSSEIRQTSVESGIGSTG